MTASSPDQNAQDRYGSQTIISKREFEITCANCGVTIVTPTRTEPRLASEDIEGQPLFIDWLHIDEWYERPFEGNHAELTAGYLFERMENDTFRLVDPAALGQGCALPQGFQNAEWFCKKCEPILYLIGRLAEKPQPQQPVVALGY